MVPYLPLSPTSTDTTAWYHVTQTETARIHSFSFLSLLLRILDEDGIDDNNFYGGWFVPCRVFPIFSTPKKERKRPKGKITRPQIRVQLKIIFLISQPRHMLWVLKRTEHPKHMF